MTLEQLEAIEAMREALKEARSWNNADIRAFEDITPSMGMLRARRKVITKALKVDAACAGQSTE